MSEFINPLSYDPQDWYSIFCRLDHDNDGLIPVGVLRVAVMENSSLLGLQKHEAEILLRDVDTNMDNYVDFSEFSAMMAKAKSLYIKRLTIYAARSVLAKSQQSSVVRYLSQYNCFPPPLFMLLISITQIAVYLYYALDSKVGISTVGPVPVSSPLILDPNHKEQVWRFLTYMFIHIGYTHILSNVAVQILLGIPLELVHKLWRIAGVYLLGVITGSLLVTAIDPTVYLGGASGGVYALLSAHLSNVIINWDEMEFNWIRAIIIMVLVTVDFGSALYQRYFVAAVSRVSYVSHIGGFIGGLLLGIVLLRNLKLRKWEVYAWWVCLVAYVLLISVCTIIIFAPGLYSK
ncbi:unnamed protein product [Bursaphelenchus xylophilus]|uniref:rhomboid protease n=1 Tax=Bursaphelenchus xylophilus TaxID=6326 RepID=A0A1I7SWB0_BURXY|nr:unnamed protein product [Bursaphelenchus xylophilus]CAG9099115.1 unnamed protein product [Bursaphelenchus xylophilus]